jgi:hypothetical protein
MFLATNAISFGQNDFNYAPAAWSEPVLPRQLLLGNYTSPESDNADFASRPPRFRLFRIPAAFLSNPVGLDSDDEFTEEAAGPASGDASMDGVGRWGLALGSDNPFFDVHRRGDPGGIGYYRAYTQYQIYETDTTHCSFNLQAATPAGLEGQGVAGGPTVLTPALAYFQELDSGAALQAFVGKNFTARSGWTDGLARSLHYGIALQRPLGLDPFGTGSSVHVFVEALGRSRFFAYGTESPSSSWEVLPGLHWRVGDNCWMSGGVIVPLNNQHFDPGLVQITCWWKF